MGRSAAYGLTPERGHTPATAVQAPCCAPMQCLCERFPQQKESNLIEAGCTAYTTTVLAALLAWPLTRSTEGRRRLCIAAWQGCNMN